MVMGPPTVPFQQSVDGMRSAPFVPMMMRVAGSVDVHGPGDAEVEHDAALQADERGGEIVHVKALGAPPRI